MDHILLSLLLVGLSLIISSRRANIEIAYLFLSWVPVTLLLIAKLHELALGFRRFNEVIYHFAYDTSYILVLVGIGLLLRAVFKKKSEKILILGTAVAAIPVVVLIISQWR